MIQHSPRPRFRLNPLVKMVSVSKPARERIENLFMSWVQLLSAAILMCLAVSSGSNLSLAQIGSSPKQASDLIAEGEDALSKGKFELAVQNFGRALRAEDLDEALVAKTLYQRGVANERAGRPAQAIADLTGALYLPSLSTADRAKAYLSRGRAYEAVGLADQARSDIAKARSGGVDERQVARSAELASSSSGSGDAPTFATVSEGAQGRSRGPSFETRSERAGPPAPSFETRSDPVETRRAAPKPEPERQRVAAFETQSRAAPAEEEKIPRFRTTILPSDDRKASPPPSASSRTIGEPDEESSGRVGRFIGNLWSSATGKDKETATPAPPTPPAAAPAPQWNQTTNVARAPAPNWDARISSPSQPAPPAPPAPVASGQARLAPGGANGYRIQLAALKSDAEAQATWKRLRSKHPALLGSWQPNIVRTELGGLGTFYRVQVGPFADKAESQKLCKSFKAGGLDCFLLAP